MGEKNPLLQVKSFIVFLISPYPLTLPRIALLCQTEAVMK